MINLAMQRCLIVVHRPLKLVVVAVGALGLALAGPLQGAEPPPAWLYTTAAGPAGAAPAAAGMDKFAPCAVCHGANGMGHAGSAPLAGLPQNYLLAQLLAFRDGSRRSSSPAMGGTVTMVEIAKRLSDTELRDAAGYFAALKPTATFRVVETDSVTLPGGNKEALGQRILEMPDPDRPGGYVAFVPPRSLNRGAVVVTTGRSKTQPCGICHGKDLRGSDDVPAIAGRSPTYLMRQLVDMRTHARTGKGVESMKTLYEMFRDADLLAVAAFVASRSP